MDTMAAGSDAAIAAARAVTARFGTASDAELLADGAAIETLGRLVDALRVGFAAEAERRSAPMRGAGRLSFTRGARDGVELVQTVARIGRRDARARIALGAAITGQATFTGHEVPARHPQVGAAVRSGRIGIEAARVIATTVEEVRARVAEDRLEAMTASLVQVAETVDVETLRDAAVTWALAVDPDGAEPRERVQRRRRALKLGRTLTDGTTSLSMVLTAEDLAFVRELLASRRRGGPLIRIDGGSDADPGLDGPEWRPEDDRTRAQQDYDTALAALHAGADTVDNTPPTQEVVVTITAAELEARAGQGWTAGVMAGLPVPVVERQTCTGGVRLLVTGEGGEALWLSRSRRVFTTAQKKALTLTAGGRCQYPGCRVPHPYLEAHHARWWNRDHGKTDIDNGVMLCSFHHHLIHAVDSPIRIIRHHGAHHLVPATWLGPPDPAHRLHTGPPPAQAA